MEYENENLIIVFFKKACHKIFKIMKKIYRFFRRIVRKIIKKFKKGISNLKKFLKPVFKRLDYVLVKILYDTHRLHKVFVRRKQKNNNQEKNIMFMIYYLKNGGAERAISHISEELSKKYNVILVTVEKEGQSDYECNVKRINLDINKIKYFRHLGLIKQIKKIKKEYNITHTISFTSLMNYYNVMSELNDETIISVRNYVSKSKQEKKNEKINKISAKYAKKMVAVSKLVVQDQVDNYGAKEDKIEVIYNYCDGEKIDKFLEEKNDINYDEHTIINVGRLSYQKCHFRLIEAFKKVVDVIPNAKLVILGYGPLQEEIEEQIQALNLQNNVFLIGFKQNPYIYMKKASVFVLSSLYEGMSNALLEALYCGLPIVTTDCKAGTREIIAPNTKLMKVNKEMTKEEYGILVPVMKNKSDEDYMAQALIEMLQNNEMRKRYALKAKERSNDFLKDKIIDKWFKIVEEL